jgi:hypothetical protein
MIEAVCPGGYVYDFVEAMNLDAIVVPPDYEIEEIGDGLYRDEWGVVRKSGHESYLIPVEEKAPLHSKRDVLNYIPL